jgi:hypothetical protein
MTCLSNSFGFPGKILLRWRTLFWIINFEMAMTMRSILSMLLSAVDLQVHWSLDCISPFVYAVVPSQYLDMIWYDVSLDSIPEIFWSAICAIDEAIDNINFPSDRLGVMKLVDDWSKKRRDRNGFTTNMGTMLVLDGFVIEIKKPNTSDLDGRDVGIYRNCKRFRGLISQVACDSNATVRIIQTNWPGATNDLMR